MVSIRLSISSIQSHLETTINPILYSPYPRIIAQRIKKPKLNYSLSIHQPWTRKMTRIDRPSIQSNHFLRRKKKPLTPSPRIIERRNRATTRNPSIRSSLFSVCSPPPWRREDTSSSSRSRSPGVRWTGVAIGTKTNPFRLPILWWILTDIDPSVLDARREIKTFPSAVAIAALSATFCIWSSGARPPPLPGKSAMRRQIAGSG